MARDEEHGGGAWGFLRCIWSPTQTKAGNVQGWWDNQKRVKAGDRVLHLRGSGNDAKFVGLSVCLTDGERTSDRPPNPGEWGYSDAFYRTPLDHFESFGPGVLLAGIFREKDTDLREYFERNRAKPNHLKLTLFYVIQSGRLQCQNGAYLSEADTELVEILLSNHLPGSSQATASSIVVGERIEMALGRIKQDDFSKAVKRNYNGRCCFPECAVIDEQFLIGAHIARWSDVKELRGELSNGLCLCLMHDKAFERGLFTLDENNRVCVLPRALQSTWGRAFLSSHHRSQIGPSGIRPSIDAILHHWTRIGY